MNKCVKCKADTEALLCVICESKEKNIVLSMPTPITSANPKTGSQRYNAGKPGSSEIDPKFILGIADVMTKAREKYARGNWCLGNNWSVPYDSMMRHLMAFQSGEMVDKESGKNHLLHCATNIMILYYYVQNFPELDDRLFKDNKSDE